MINQLKTVLLLGILTGLLLLIGSFFGTSGLTIAIVFVLIMNVGSYFFSDKLALAMYRAKEIKKTQFPWLHVMVKDICKEANIPEPKGIYLIPTEQSNAFCAGRGPKHYVVACTQGILDLLTRDELKGVLAHEIAHSKNRDVLVATIAATIAGVISYLAQMAQFGAMFGGFGRDDDKGGNIIGLLVLAILTPIIAMIIQMAISRSREYLADETGAKLIKDSKPLASALVKIHHSVKNNPLKFGSQAGSSLFIANPFRGNALTNLFSTHPSLEDRLKHLKEVKV
ncbi:MAG: zinc metalloprotease HtpX [Candidatus Nanoarchaeia archaeon]|nr:zinc metalloprotease HtpX [Candidatus Nanoarchaeia archaeon]